MLTRELISARLRRNLVVPVFLNPPTAMHLHLAEELLAVFRECAGRKTTANELEERLAPAVNGAFDRRLALALRKLLMDRCEFSGSAQIDFAGLRREIFLQAASLLQGDVPLGEYRQYNAALKAALPENVLLRQGDLYGDLPENDRLEKFDGLTASQLLERYNVALVQGLLLFAERLQMTVAASDMAQLRRLFQYVRFFGLLCSAEGDDEEAVRRNGGRARLKLTIDGPASILEQNHRYGMQLALFFPAVCTVGEWQMSAEVEWRGGRSLLKLDQDSGLKCHYHNFAAYVPDEIKLFRQYFQSHAEGEWCMVDVLPFLRGKGHEVITPDFTFRHSDGRVVHLELFNRWHAGGLPERIAWLEKHPQLPLLLGVDRRLLRKMEVAAAVENSPWFARYGFTYRDYPTCEKVRRLLVRYGAKDENKEKTPAKRNK